MARVLITGICGSLAQLCADRLLDDGHEVIGVDYRPKRRGMRGAIQFFQGNYNKRIISDVFRKHTPDQVLHLGRVGNLKATPGKRFDLNVVGSGKIMELCLEHQVKRLVVLSTYHIYGAHPHNHIPIFEEEPLRAGQTFPEIADAVQLDNMASNWVYRHRTLKTVVLRPCNVIGPNLRNAITSYLQQDRVYSLWGYSPMWQFIHERDMVEALICSLNCDAVGVFNVAGAGAISLGDALRLTGARHVSIPSPLAHLVLAVNRRAIPAYFLDFLRYPCVISDDKFRKTMGFTPKVGLRETIESSARR